MNRFIRFAALRWMYNVIVPPRYRDKLNITEELCSFENALNKVIEVTNANGMALDAISKDLEDIQFGAGGYYTPTITVDGGMVTISFTASDDSLPPIESVSFNIGDPQTVEEMLQGFDGEPMSVKNYIDRKAGEGGKSAYDIYLDNGGFLSEKDWLESLKGARGYSFYDICVQNGFNGSETDLIAAMKGDTGKTPIFEVEEVASCRWNEPPEVNINNTDPEHPILDFSIPQGVRGPGILKVTTTPTSYTTTIAGTTPIKRMSISTIKNESKFGEVLVGDIIQHSSYLYHIYYLDSTYAYMDTSLYIKGSDGTAGKDGKTPVKGVDYLTDDDSETWTFTLEDGSTVTKKVVVL